MAITRQKKETQVEEFVQLLGDAKLTAIALYQGLSVKELQALRRAAAAADVKIKVVKNRLVRVAMGKVEHLKNADIAPLKAQLLYAISTTDEVAPAQVLAKFAKDHEALQLVGAYNSTGALLNSDDVKALANLPTKEQLRGMLVGTLAAPLSGFVNVLAGNVRGVLNVLNARSKALEN
jgi:large subunit ribosomal protein L10